MKFPVVLVVLPIETVGLRYALLHPVVHAIRLVKRRTTAVMTMMIRAGLRQVLLMKYRAAQVVQQIEIADLKCALRVLVARVTLIVRKMARVVMITMRFAESLQVRQKRSLVAQVVPLTETVGTKYVLQLPVALVIPIVRKMAHVAMIMTRLAGSLQVQLRKSPVAQVVPHIGIAALRYVLNIPVALVILIAKRTIHAVMITMRLVG